MTKCQGSISSIPCDRPAMWRNQNGVCCCDAHRILLDAFTWEGREHRIWEYVPMERSHVDLQHKEPSAPADLGVSCVRVAK